MLPATRLGVKKAARIAISILNEGGSAVDAVEAAVCSMEDDPIFDSGTGSSLNANGQVEMDAVIMDGSSLRAGGVACVQNIAHPVQLARLVMDKTQHVLLVGAGANEFAQQNGVIAVPSDQLVTKVAQDELHTVNGQFTITVDDLYNRRCTTNTTSSPVVPPVGRVCDDNKVAAAVAGATLVNAGQLARGCDTVGAAAVDRCGNVAFATSTGGITGKMPGRVGDSPLVGAGGYADNEIGAISSTGHGESIIKVCLAHHAITLMRQGLSGQQAIESALDYMCRRVGGCGGLIVVDSRSGTVGHYSTAQRMAWASASLGLLRHGVELTDDFVEPL
jgi:beta-aspartyl-peptidase (threonine type)